MKRDDVFPSKYLKAADLNGRPVTVTIKGAPYETLKNPEGKEQGKTVLYFVRGKKGAALKYRELGQRRRDLRRRHRRLAGPPDRIYSTVTQMGPKTVPCIRIRRPRGTLPLAARPGATPAPMPAETSPAEAYPDADFGDDLPEAFR